ncbi:MAG: hypothetical protein JWP66_367 [Naasia sp.]|nr:hypothetical protein [Naasia sp.]
MQWSELGLDVASGEDLGAGRVGGARIGGAPHEIPDPANGGMIATVGWAGAEHVDVAVSAARDAQREWVAIDVRERARLLRRIADDLRASATPLGDLICAESGKRLEEAVAEVHFSARYFDWFADAATRLESDYYETPQRRFVVDRKPVKVVAAISPWNFPLSIPVRKLAAALAAGSGVVQKPSELAPLSSLALTAMCERLLPRGLVSVLIGDGAALTPALIDHPDVGAVSFTGSTAVGRIVAERAAKSLTRAVLELGGRAPFIVCEDADLEVAVDAMIIAKLRNNGESCVAANNYFVHTDRYDEVLERVRSRLAGVAIGDPRGADTGLGPLIRPREVERFTGLIDSARSAGDEVSLFGDLPADGWFAPIAVVESRADSAAWSSEVFSPMFSIRRYADEAEVVREINGWRTGLGGYVMSSDVEHQFRLARSLDVGIVGINNGAPNTPEVPFGGRDDSGLGREGGLSGMLEFTAEQTLSFAR